ncbi:hypothetical protein A6R68_07066 [Neotoma lepida]|uniref:Uncharacterized protein n=1 Tax=Neotoma lepida TaxID=56216 RepID=A0A1A6GDU3_NEOLE|nr:hypothetical protein A6R68_07066 [Neotoma lepida]
MFTEQFASRVEERERKESRREEGGAWDRRVSVQQERWPELGGWHRGYHGSAVPALSLGSGNSQRRPTAHLRGLEGV